LKSPTTTMLSQVSYLQNGYTVIVHCET